MRTPKLTNKELEVVIDAVCLMEAGDVDVSAKTDEEEDRKKTAIYEALESAKGKLLKLKGKVPEPPIGCRPLSADKMSDMELLEESSGIVFDDAAWNALSKLNGVDLTLLNRWVRNIVKHARMEVEKKVIEDGAEFLLTNDELAALENAIDDCAPRGQDPLRSALQKLKIEHPADQKHGCAATRAECEQEGDHPDRTPCSCACHDAQEKKPKMVHNVGIHCEAKIADGSLAFLTYKFVETTCPECRRNGGLDKPKSELAKALEKGLGPPKQQHGGG